MKFRNLQKLAKMIMFFTSVFFMLNYKNKERGLIMTKKLEMYKCEICGNFVEVVLAGAGELVCCGQPMKLLNANSTDAAGEKHVPFFIKKDDELEIRVGSVLHPMTEEHYIQWVECLLGETSYMQELKPNSPAEAKFSITGDLSNLTVRAYCNVHGLWKK